MISMFLSLQEYYYRNMATMLMKQCRKVVTWVLAQDFGGIKLCISEVNYGRRSRTSDSRGRRSVET